MRELVFIQFSSGWVPPTHRRINITNRRFIKSGISKNGNEYMVMSGHITDEDATLLMLLDQHADIREIGEQRNDSRNSKKFVYSKNRQSKKSI